MADKQIDLMDKMPEWWVEQYYYMLVWLKKNHPEGYATLKIKLPGDNDD